MRPNVKTEVMEHRDPATGAVYLLERLEAEVDVSALDVSDEYRDVGCGACKKHGNNLACPPFSPSLRAYIGKARTARVIAYRAPLAQFPEDGGPEVDGDDEDDLKNEYGVTGPYRMAYRLMRELLTAELLVIRAKGAIVGGSGPCRVCPRCAILKGSVACSAPLKRIYSLESMGVNLITLSEQAFGIPLEWSSGDSSADYVSAIGAVFE